MKGIQTLVNAIRTNYERLCCIVANTAESNTILATLATEATQLDVLAAIDMMRDYEVRLVVDDNDVTWLEVRYWDAQDGTLGTPVYYPPGSTVAGTPTGPLSYISPNTLLAQMLTELQNINTTATTIAADTTVLATPETGLATSLTRVAAAGTATVAAGKRRVTFANMGNADATVAGGTLKAGEIVSFVADGLRDTLAAISYDALTSELLITTVG